MKKHINVIAFLLSIAVLFYPAPGGWAAEIREGANDDSSQAASLEDDEDSAGEEEDAGGEETDDEDDLELQAYLEEAEKALGDVLSKETVMALVYLCDSYEVKKAPGLSSAAVVKVTSGTTVVLKGMGLDEDYNIWYQADVDFNGSSYSGYIERSYLAYSNEFFLEWEDAYFPQTAVFAAQGSAYPDVEQFPESYQDKLIRLKQAHPNWIFVKQDTRLEWETVVKNEDYKDRNLIHQSMGAAYKGDKHSPGWYFATNAAVKYYLDPRNFLDDTRIFQFEQLTYNPSYHSKAAIQNILSTTFMKGDLPGAGMTYADAFYQIGVSLKVSPFHLACRVYQEQGQGTSPLISGNYTETEGYKGYYNYFNIGASGTTTKQVIETGLARAVKEGWNTRYKALNGGAVILSKNYILRGQDTLYLQKFDVDASDGTLYTHQYMQNITAPYTESQMVKKAYIGTGSLDNPFVFKIPVYRNMPAAACPIPTAAASPTATPTASAKPTATATPTASAKPTATATPTASAKPTATATPTASATPTATATPTASATPTATAAPTASATPKVTATPTASAIPKVTATPTASATPKVTATPTAKATPMATIVPMATTVPMPTTVPVAKATPTATAAPMQKETPAATARPAATPVVESEPTVVPAAKATATVVPAAIPSPTAKQEEKPKATASPGREPAASAIVAPTWEPVPVGTAAATKKPDPAIATASPEEKENSPAAPTWEPVPAGTAEAAKKPDPAIVTASPEEKENLPAAPTWEPVPNEAEPEAGEPSAVNSEEVPAKVSSETVQPETAAPEGTGMGTADSVSAVENTNSAGLTIAAATPRPLADTEEKETIIMDMSRTNMVYAQTLQQIKEQGREVILKMNDKVSWTIDGSRIENDDLADINLTVELGGSRIPEDKLAILAGGESYIELSLAHEGEFGFTALLTVELDDAQPGQYANLFYYNEETGDFEFMCASLISSMRKAVFEFKHASDYVIIISDGTKENLLMEKAGEMEAAKAQAVEAMAQAKEELPAKEPGKAAGIIAVILFASAVVGIGAYLIFKKKDNE